VARNIGLTSEMLTNCISAHIFNTN